MLYGLGAAAPDTLGTAIAALPSCFSQELLNCLWHQNEQGLPESQCTTIRSGYTDEKSEDSLDSAIYALPVCGKASDMIPYVGMAFAVGVLAASLVLHKR